MNLKFSRNLHLNCFLLAVRLDKCNVKGFSVKSLMDDVDYTGNLQHKYGIYHVDFQDPDRPRTMKTSAKFLMDIIKDNGFIPSKSYTVQSINGESNPNYPYRPLVQENEMYYGSFPNGFAWSTATAAYQIEGGWDSDGMLSIQKKNIIFKRLAYMLTAYCYGSKSDATGCYLYETKLDKSFTKQLGQIAILEHCKR